MEMTIEDTLRLAERFWIGSAYMQFLNPDRAAFLLRVRGIRELELGGDRDDGAANNKQRSASA